MPKVAKVVGIIYIKRGRLHVGKREKKKVRARS